MINKIPLTPHSQDPYQVNASKILSEKDKSSHEVRASGPQQIGSENNTSYVAREYVTGIIDNIEVKDYVGSNNMPDSNSQRI